ncbi:MULTISPECIES: nicotinate-nucleotide adenylyltransferase [Methylomonas]|uniref:nicotinate-nucleotide adenylyltransferase n=1 Tax=Methylomonas TaxID=416 RepID=UPI001232E701|nr:nicotinate-nucleotide adenylyltransferase [Methylomonas rhizoryzae]
MIGVYGGTFNPVHFGHLRTAVEVQERFGLRQLHMIPCRLPAHRERPEVDGERRYAMLQLALAGLPGVIADRRELDRPGPSYMVDTLQSLRDDYPHVGLLLFIGTDAFAGLPTWHCWQRLFELAHVVVVTRPGYRPPRLADFLAEKLTRHDNDLVETPQGCLHFQTVTALDISATAIRNLIAGNHNPQFLLPDSVIAYIRRHNLYLA